MKSLLHVGQQMLSVKRRFIITVIRHQTRSYSLSYEVAEKIKSVK